VLGYEPRLPISPLIGRNLTGDALITSIEIYDTSITSKTSYRSLVFYISLKLCASHYIATPTLPSNFRSSAIMPQGPHSFLS
jgi:hypothetical protein